MKQKPKQKPINHPIPRAAPIIPKLYRWFLLFSLLLHIFLLCLLLWYWWPERSGSLQQTQEQEFIISLDGSLPSTASRLDDGPAQGERHKPIIPDQSSPPSKTPNQINNTSPSKTPNQTRDASTTTPNSEQTVGVGGDPADVKPHVELNEKNVRELFSGGGDPVYYSRNPGARKLGLDLYGGTRQSEDAVEAGLSWLIRHQDNDGKWDGHDFTGHCQGDKSCFGQGNKKYTPGLTALAFMCFLAAGYTPTTTTYGKHLTATQNYLLACQDEAGLFGQKDMYNHALVTLALIEWYGQGHDIRLAQPIRKAVQATMLAQQPGGGWSYDAYPIESRNDTSVTGWQMLHLLAAQKMGFGVPSATLARAWDHFAKFTLPTGEVRYADIGPQAFRKTDALTAAGLLCALVYGKIGEVQKRQVMLLQEALPDWGKISSLDHSMYYWYHAHLAFFIIGGQPWQKWNSKLQHILLAHQVKSGEARGSWPPEDKWGNSGGRLYSTTINILNLEIYYRYQPAFLHSLSPATIESLRGKK
jgi:hypothetical protein